MSENAKRVVMAEGYEEVHSEESWGERFFGLKIFVKMYRAYDSDRDSRATYKAADDLKRALETVSAELDPVGPVMREKYREQIAAIYSDARVGAVYMEPLPNGYCSNPCCLNKPWFRVTSAVGHVVIGWRKSVISIDWKDSLVKKSGSDLFPAENVTRWETGIHAWGVEKAIEYIRRLHAERP